MIPVYKYPPPEDGQAKTFDEWFTEHDCTEHQWSLTRYVLKNKTVQYRNQCNICGVSTNPIKHSQLYAKDKREAIDYDTELSRAYYAEMQDAYSAWVESNRHTHSWWTWYKAYLDSPCWKARRKDVIRRAGGIREACGADGLRPWEFEIHHLTYERVGREPLYDLVAVCAECHAQLTEWKR